MFVGVCRLELEIPEVCSIKDKRRVVRSFKDRLRVKLPVSVAEVGDANRHCHATIAVVTVSPAVGVCHKTLDRAAAFADRLPDAVLADVQNEVIPFGSGGRSLSGVTWPAGTASGTDVETDDDPLPWGQTDDG